MFSLEGKKSKKIARTSRSFQISEGCSAEKKEDFFCVASGQAKPQWWELLGGRFGCNRSLSKAQRAAPKWTSWEGSELPMMKVFKHRGLPMGKGAV